jgi:hypothetical protein
LWKLNKASLLVAAPLSKQILDGPQAVVGQFLCRIRFGNARKNSGLMIYLSTKLGFFAANCGRVYAPIDRAGIRCYARHILGFARDHSTQ